MALILGWILAGANQIAHYLMSDVRHPEWGQFADAKQPSQTHGIQIVSLHPVTGAGRDERRGDNTAVEAMRAYL